MPFTVDYLDDKGIVVIVNIGKLNYNDYVNQTINAVKLGHKKNSQLFLSDCSQLVSLAKTIEIYDMPAMFKRVGLPRTSRIALLMAKDAATKKYIRFFETVCYNRGWHVKIFNHKDEAIVWLLE